MFFSQPALRAARLLFAAAALLLPAAPTLAQGTIQINAIAIDYFDLKDRELRRFGKLEFRGGLQLTSPTREFGGISGLRIMPDGSGFLAVTDMGRWLRGRITYAGSAPSGIADAVMAPMLSADGKRLAARGLWDTEAIADDRGTIYVGIERKHQIVKFDFAKSGFKARAVAVPVPDEFKDFPNNEGIEALAIVPKGQPLAGTLIAITEKALDASGNIKGFLLGGPIPDRSPFGSATIFPSRIRQCCPAAISCCWSGAIRPGGAPPCASAGSPRATCVRAPPSTASSSCMPTSTSRWITTRRLACIVQRRVNW